MHDVLKKTIDRGIEDILETETKSEEKIKIVRYKERERQSK